MLLHDVERSLDKHDWTWAEWTGHGCFSLAASKKTVMLLKVLENVDSFMPEQAKNLKILSENLDASAALIGKHTRYESLRNYIIYDRFEVPTFTHGTLEAVLDSDLPHVLRDRGGLFVGVDPKKLRDARKNAGLTQFQLAEQAGVTKKAIYEHENRRMKMRSSIAGRIEKLIGEEITIPFTMKALETDETNAPQNMFESNVGRTLHKIGFTVSFVYKNPFNIIAEERTAILSDAEPVTRIKRKAEALAKMAETVKRPAIAITDEPVDLKIPTISRRLLNELTPRDVRKLAKNA
jgi:putative transcriptional regulator